MLNAISSTGFISKNFQIVRTQLAVGNLNKSMEANYILPQLWESL